MRLSTIVPARRLPHMTDRARIAIIGLGMAVRPHAKSFSDLGDRVEVGLGAGFYRGTWSSLRMGTFNMDSLIAIGTSTAIMY